LSALIFVFGCGTGESTAPDGGTGGGAAGATGAGGTSSGSGGTTGVGGTTGTGGTSAGAAGSSATGTAGNSGGASGAAGSGSGGRGGTSAGTGGDGAGGVTGAGGGTAGATGSGGSNGGRGGTGNSSGGRGGSAGSGSAGTGGSGTGGSGTGGSGTGTGGSGTGGTGTPPGPSGLPIPPGPSNVAKPSGTPGNLTVINWAGFKAAVTYSFDDDNDSQISNYSMLQAAGGQYTFFMWTNRTQAQNAIWKTALNDGHEIGNHTKSHDSNGACTLADVQAGGQFIMTTFNKPALTFAAPNGSTCYKQYAQQLYFIDRGVSPATPVMPNDNSDPLNLNCYIPAQGQQASVFNGNIDNAHSVGGWVIYVVHGFSTSDGSYQPVDIGQMTTAIKYAKAMTDMWVGSMVNVGAYWAGQKAVTKGMTTTSGSNKTYTWTLPAHFPTGHYVRVKVDGGTLTQNGTALAWDPHGYYEVALDPGSVTLGP
jgi:hypothetical protein